MRSAVVPIGGGREGFIDQQNGGGFADSGDVYKRQEHDLTYVGCSGLLSFANSGPTWGESAKRITVMRHSASRVIAMTHVSDLTLIDVQAYKREEAKDYRNEAYEFDTGTFFVNCDGLQMRGCTAEGGIKFTNRSSRSRRRNLLDGCAFHQPAGDGTRCV